MMLPLLNRTGDTEIVDRLESRLRSRLEVHLTTTNTVGLRDDLRQLRMRAPSRARPADLVFLAERYDIDWFLSVTLHHAARSRNDEIIVSAEAFEKGAKRLLWADIFSATSWDYITWFGMGQGWALEDLADDMADRLADSLTGSDSRKPPLRLGRSKRGYARHELREMATLPIAVIPLSSVTEKETAKAAEVATAALKASLHERSLQLLHPGIVDWALRLEGKYQLGAVDAPARNRLRETENVTAVLTGTVERFELRPAFRDGSRVELSLRAVDTGSGEILWIDGADHTGFDTKTVFEQNIIHSTGVLTREVVNSLIAGVPSFRKL